MARFINYLLSKEMLKLTIKRIVKSFEKLVRSWSGPGGI